MTKERLKEYKWIQKNIKNLTETLEELRSQAECKSPRLSSEPKGNYKTLDQIPKLIAEIEEVENELQIKLRQAYELLTEIEDCISALPEKEKCLMRLRYIHDKRWKDICVEMSYSLEQVHRIHRSTLKYMSATNLE